MKPDAQTNPAPRARELFMDALDRAPGERAAFLSSACGDNAKLRAEVEELLREHEQVGDFLATPAMLDRTPGSTIRLSAEALAAMEKAGDRIGRYKLLQQIGEGGCGIVYMAEQEEPVRRRVALKIIKLGMDTKSVIARFEAERQALAMMEHPNIARVFDAGATETGRPYFVMELVRGVRITEYCDANNLTTEQRLGLFIQVCQAIQHAHQKGIIHRDIKPSNILVTLHDDVAVPKVIDFGIAKATEQRLTDKTLFTEFQSFIGTPAYMSPEQAQLSGLDIDTRSDVYALGVLLYEMLTGTTPFDPRELMQLGLEGVRKRIREEEPARPSTRLSTMISADLTATAERRRTEAPRLIHSLRGDLDWIVMKCLEKDRTRRYATANDLAADVQRFLVGDTVLARPPSNVYLLQKFLRRHQRAVAAAAVIAFTLLTASVLSTWLAIRATRAERKAQGGEARESGLRQRAERERASARLNEYVADINLAEQSRQAGNYGRAVQLLNKHRPAPGEPDLRGFAWRYLWQLTRGDEHIDFPPQDEPVQSVALSPSGEFLAVGLERKLNIWNLRSQALVTSLKRGASSLAFLPDGRTLLAADFRGTRLVNTEDWMERQALPGTSSALFLSSNGMRLATSGREGVRVWDTATWTEVRTLPDASSPFSLSPDGSRLVADARDGSGLMVWNLNDATNTVLLAASTNLFLRRFGFRNDRALTFSPDGDWIVAARNTPSEHGVFVLGIWDAATGEEVEVMPGDPENPAHTGGITSIVFSPDGRTMATASMDYSIRLWDFDKRQRLGTLHGHLNEVLAIGFSRDGRQIVSGARGGGLKLWPTRPQPRDEEFAGARVPLAFSTNSTKLAALSRQDSVLFLDLRAGTVVDEFPLEPPRSFNGPGFRPRAPTPLAVGADLKTIAVAKFDGSLKLINTLTRATNLLRAAGQPISTLALAPDGRTLVTGGWEGGLRWWDVREGTNFVVESQGERALFAGDSATLALFNREGTIELWNVATRSLRTNILVDPPPNIGGSSGSPAAFSSDGRWLAVACQDDAIRVWDADTAALIGTLVGHKQTVYTVAFAPDGTTLASASDDSTLKFWHLPTQQELLTVTRLGGGLRALTFSPDGRALVAGTSSTLMSGGLRIFRAPTLAEIDALETRVVAEQNR